MWMLLDPSARKPIAPKVATDVAAGDVGARRRASKPRSASARLSLHTFLGAAAEAPRASGAEAPVSVFLHPGRAPVGTAGVERVYDQFECAAPEVYATLAEAEARHEGEVGFLLEVSRPFTDPRGGRHERGVLFARSIRD